MPTNPLFSFFRLTRWLAYAGVVSLFLAMTVTIADIVLRAVSRLFNLVAGAMGAEPIGLAVPGVVELVQLFVMGVAFAALPFAFMRGAHVSVDLLTARLGSRLQSLLQAAAALISLWFMVLILWHGWRQMLDQVEYGDVSMTLAIPYVWFWSPLLFGVAMSIAATVMMAAAHAVFAVSGKGGEGLRRLSSPQQE